MPASCGDFKAPGVIHPRALRQTNRNAPKQQSRCPRYRHERSMNSWLGKGSGVFCLNASIGSRSHGLGPLETARLATMIFKLTLGAVALAAAALITPASASPLRAQAPASIDALGGELQLVHSGRRHRHSHHHHYRHCRLVCHGHWHRGHCHGHLHRRCHWH